MSARLDQLFDKYDENPLDPDIIYSIVKEYLKNNNDDEAEVYLKDLNDIKAVRVLEDYLDELE